MRNKFAIFLIVLSLLIGLSCNFTKRKDKEGSSNDKSKYFSDFDWISMKGVNEIEKANVKKARHYFLLSYDTLDNLTEVLLTENGKIISERLNFRNVKGSKNPIFSGLVKEIELKKHIHFERDSVLKLSADTSISKKTIKYKQPNSRDFVGVFFWIKRNDSTIIYEFYAGNIEINLMDSISINSFIESAKNNLLDPDDYKQKRVYHFKNDKIIVDFYDQGHWKSSDTPLESYEIVCPDRNYFYQINRLYKIFR